MIRNTIIIASIWSKNMLRYLSLDIVCSSKLAVFLKLHTWKNVCFSEHIMSAKNYLGICWCEIICNVMFNSDVPFCKSRFRSSSERTHKWRHVELGDGKLKSTTREGIRQKKLNSFLNFMISFHS